MRHGGRRGGGAAALTVLTRRAAEEHLTDGACAPTAPGPPRLGVEQEWHTYRLDEPDRHLRPDEVLAAAEAGGALPHASRITVEPGGQVELSTRATAPWWACLDSMRVDGAELRRRLLDAGVVAVPGGVDVFRAPLRTLCQPRYDVMQAFFDRQGPEGRRMMSGCAAIQVNVDTGDASTADARWQLAHRVGPALAAAFACSPGPTHRSERLANWHAMDPTRTRPALAAGQLGADWVAYVLAAEVMVLLGEDGAATLPPPGITFEGWLEQGIDGRLPTVADLDYHCSTLFPPVRPRGWLELRWVDALPAGVAELAAAATAAVLLDDEAAGRAELACEAVAGVDFWDLAAELGPRHAGLATAAAELLRIAADALGRSEADPAWATRLVEAAERWPSKGRCPADDLEALLADGGGPAALADPPVEVTWWPG